MQAQKTIVIFGISSFIGSNLAKNLKKHYRIIGTYLNCPVTINGVITLKCNVLEREQINKIVTTFKPDVCIYAIGLSSVEICSHKPKLADALNTSGLINVTECSERNKARVVFLSSGLVFDGKNASYAEKDNSAPTTVYGRTNAASEYFLQNSCLNYLIFRCCPLYGRSFNPRQSTWFETLELNLIGNESFFMDDYIVSGFLDPDFLALVIRMTLELEIKNRLLQVSSKDIMTRFKFTQLFCEKFEMNKSLVKKGTWNFPEIEKRAELLDNLYYNFNCENIEDLLNIYLPSIEESLAHTFSKLGGKNSQKANGSKNSTGVNYI